MNISTRTTGTKIKTGPGQGPIIGIRNDRDWDRDKSSGPEMTGIGTGPGTGTGPETFSADELNDADVVAEADKAVKAKKDAVGYSMKWKVDDI